MKREHWKVFLAAAALAFAMAVSAVGCLVSGFKLQLENPTAVTLACACFALLGALCFSLKRGGFLILGLLALMGGYLWYGEIAAEQFRSLIQRIAHVYDSAYGWGEPALTEIIGPVDQAVGIPGAFIALAVSRTVCRGKGGWLAIGAAVLPLALCLVVTDTVPGEGYLLTLMAGVVLLLLTAEVRRDSVFQGVRLLLRAAIPVAAALGLLFLLVPQGSYVNQTEELWDALHSLTEDMPYTVENTGGKVTVTVQSEAREDIDLRTTGSQIRQTYPVMDVTSQHGGTLYLRGQDYDAYSGTGWSSTTGRTEPFTLADGEGDTVAIRTRGAKSVFYLPYYPAGETVLTDGSLANPERLKEYTFHCARLPDGWREMIHAASYPGEVREYLDLPDGTRTRAEALLASFLPEDASDLEKAEAIGDYVRSSAAYDLGTGRMPAGEEDFALWFLEKSETGYCVHFATAAAVLLRAAGIPARYVSGYMVEAGAGETVTVIAGNAHAWAEYHVPGLGQWVVLEATPALPGEEEPVETTQVPTAAETEPSPEPTVPRQTTAASSAAVTEPVDATEPVKDLRWLTNGAKPLALAALLLCGISLQRALRLLLRQRRRQKGEPNARALACWREIALHGKLLKEEPPEELLTLAQKAKFSQHTMTDAELGQMEEHLRDTRRRLGENPWYLRLVYRYIYAAY